MPRNRRVSRRQRNIVYARNMVESLNYVKGISNNYQAIVREINYHQYNLKGYIIKLCIQTYNSAGGSHVENLETNVRNNVNKIINEEISVTFPDINRRNANRAQHAAAHPVQQAQNCYICGNPCSLPHIEHVIRILLLQLITGHLELNNAVKAASLKYAHKTCNVDVKGSIPLFNVNVDDSGIVTLTHIPAAETRLMQRFQNAIRTSIPHTTHRPGYSRRARNNTRYVPRPTDLSEINVHANVNTNVDAVTSNIERLFNQENVLAEQVVTNLQSIINRCVPTQEEIFQRIQRDASSGRRLTSRGHRSTSRGERKSRSRSRDERKSRSRSREAEGLKKTKRRRPTKANKTRNKRT